MSFKRGQLRIEIDKNMDDDEDSMVEIGEIAILSSSKASLRFRSLSDINATRVDKINRKDLASKPLILDSPTTEQSKQTDEEEQVAHGPQKPATLFNKIKQSFFMVKGLLLGMSSAFIFCLSHIVLRSAKWMTGSDHALIRYIVTLIIMSIILRYKNMPIMGPKKQRVLLTLRGFFGFSALITVYFALTIINPSDVTTISHSSIVITAVLSRIFLKEKLTIAHLISVILTIVGVIFISKPSAFFPKEKRTETVTFNMSINSTDLTSNSHLTQINFTQFGFKNITDSNFLRNETNHSDFESYKGLLGISLCLFSSITSGFIYMILKKLNNSKVHWAASTIYVSWFGIPFCILISLLLFYFKISHTDFQKEKKDLPMDIFYSICASFLSIYGQVLLNIAFKYEDATKIAITKTIDVFFAFSLQYIFLNIKIDLLSVLGACSILVGTFFVLLFKLLDSKYETFKSKRGENETLKQEKSKKDCFLKTVFFKI